MFAEIQSSYANSFATTSMAAALVCFMLAALPLLQKYWWRKGPEQNDVLKIKKCPNPNCVRCRRYAELNASAQRRLPWVISVHRPSSSQSNNLDAQSNCTDRGKQHCQVNDGSIDQNKSGLNRIETSIRQGPNNNTGKRIRGQYPTVLLIDGLSSGEPFVTSQHKEACSILESSDYKKAILREYESSRSHNGRGGDWLSNDVSTAGGSWEVLHLMNQGSWVSSNVSRCPNTSSVVKSLPGLMEGCIFGNAFISVIMPGTEVEPHCGPSNVRHRLHFPLLVPPTSHSKQQPVLLVQNDHTMWTEGLSFVFDDSLVHSVRFRGAVDGVGSRIDCALDSDCLPRVVLIVDIWHPKLTAVEITALKDLYPASSSS